MIARECRLMLESAPRLDFVAGGIEEPYRLLMECATDYALVPLDSDGRIAAWNARAADILGYQAGEIVGRPFVVFFAPEEVAARQPEAELRAAAERNRTEHERWYVRKDGTRLWCRGTLTALRR